MFFGGCIHSAMLFLAREKKRGGEAAQMEKVFYSRGAGKKELLDKHLNRVSELAGLYDLWKIIINTKRGLFTKISII